MSKVDLSKLKKKRLINTIDQDILKNDAELEIPNKNKSIQDESTNPIGSKPLKNENNIPKYHLQTNEIDNRRDVRTNWKISRKNHRFLKRLPINDRETVKFISALIDVAEEYPEVLDLVMQRMKIKG